MTRYEELHVRCEDPFDIEPMDGNFKTDYVGTERLCKDGTGQAISIYDLAELDPDQWMVVGIDLPHAGCREYSEDVVYLWAVNKLLVIRSGEVRGSGVGGVLAGPSPG